MGCTFRRPRICDTMLFVAISLITVLRSENQILYIFYYQFIFFFLCSSQLGLSFLLYPIGLPIVKLFACFITAMLIELSPCIAVHNGKKLKRWAFHMGHVIEHWLWMTTFIGLPVMRSVWYCDCVMPFVPRHIGCVVNPRSVEWRGINFSCFPRGICLQILNPKSWWVSWDGWAHC